LISVDFVALIVDAIGGVDVNVERPSPITSTPTTTMQTSIELPHRALRGGSQHERRGGDHLTRRATPQDARLQPLTSQQLLMTAVKDKVSESKRSPALSLLMPSQGHRG
jgi:hypothetical protein